MLNLAVARQPDKMIVFLLVLPDTQKPDTNSGAIMLDAAEWRIPGVKMKMREPTLAPMSTQAIAKLEESQRLNA